MRGGMCARGVFSILLLALGADAQEAAEARAPERPNVLFVSLDDQNDWIGPLGGLGSTPRTPSFDRLARLGATFTNAHCAAPACNPSRVAVLLGLRPSSSGVYDNESDWRAVLPDALSMPRLFRDNGYEVVGFGKTFHAEDQDAGAWQRYVALPNPVKYVEHLRVGKLAWGTLPDGAEQQMPDHGVASLAAEFLGQPHERPFFLSVGFKRPHLPWIVPERYYELYDEAQIPLPRVLEHDLDDVPAAGRAMVTATSNDHAKVLEQKAWRAAVHAYLASISFADAQLGRVLDALAAGPHARDTIVCVWSDHGLHLGEKEHWRKFTLWEESTRVPFFLVVPGLTTGGEHIERAVDLVHVLPTLAELCRLDVPAAVRARWDGRSLRALLAAPDAPWDQPALTTYRRGNDALRTERWRYIRYADGAEELYDHASDPDEWHDLARDPRTERLRAELATWLPRDPAPPAPAVQAKAASKKRAAAGEGEGED